MNWIIPLTGLVLFNIGLAYYNYATESYFAFGFSCFAAGVCSMGAIAIYLNDKYK